MLIQTWGEVFGASLQNLWWGFINFVPNLIVAIIIFILGWIVGAVIGHAIEQVIAAIKIDSLFKSAGADEVLARAGIRLNVGAFLGGLANSCPVECGTDIFIARSLLRTKYDNLIFNDDSLCSIPTMVN